MNSDPKSTTSAASASGASNSEVIVGTPAEPVAGLPPELADHPEYEVLRELGRGGMGVVYLARNKRMDRLEVLKVITSRLVTKPEALERFLREIRSAAKLNHPNIVTAYYTLQLGDMLAFVMEYVPGEDLSKLVKASGPLPVANACYYAYQAALGLQEALEQGMVHRDIKPHNLILYRKGKKHIVKVLDFGLAKATSDVSFDGAVGGTAGATSSRSDLTGEGAILGTPDYVAPEQSIDAAKADIRADIYSLGCTLYYLLAGHPPFRAANLEGLLMAHHLDTPESLDKVRAEVPFALATIVAKMIAKAPTDRYQTPADVAQALAPHMKAPVSAPPPPAPKAIPLPTAQPIGAATVVGSQSMTDSLTVVAARSTVQASPVVPIAKPPDTPRLAKPAPPRSNSTLVIWIASGVGVVSVLVIGLVLALSGGTKPDQSQAANEPKKNATLITPPAPKPQAWKATVLGNAKWTRKADALESDGEGLLAFGDGNWHDYDYSFTVRKLSGKNGFSAVFRALSNDSRYEFNVGAVNNDRCTITMLDNGTNHAPQDKSGQGLPILTLPKGKREMVNLSEDYKVRVEVRGAECRCYVDVKKVLDYSRIKFAHGQVGVRSHRDTMIRVSNIVVSFPDGKDPVRGLPDLD